MSFRVGVAWIESVFAGTVANPDDARDWLAGNEAAIRARRNDRAVEAITLAGGEIA